MCTRTSQPQAGAAQERAQHPRVTERWPERAGSAPRRQASHAPMTTVATLARNCHKQQGELESRWPAIAMATGEGRGGCEMLSGACPRRKGDSETGGRFAGSC